MAATKVSSIIFPVTPRKRYRFLIEWAASSTADALTVEVKWWNATKSSSTTWTIFSKVANASSTWQIDTATLVPSTAARWAQIIISKPNVATKFGILRTEFKEFDQSLEHYARSLVFWDDFIGTAIGQNQWTRTEQSGTLSVTKVQPGTGTFNQWSETGIARIRTGATSGNGGTIQLGQSFSGPPPVGGEFRCKARVNQTTNFRAWFGLWSNASSSPDEALTNSLYGIGIRAQPAGAAENWFGICRNGTSETTVDLGVQANSTWRDLGWFKTESGVQFTVNGVGVGSVATTNIPANSQSLGIMAGLLTATSSAAELDLDYIGLQVYTSRMQ